MAKAALLALGAGLVATVMLALSTAPATAATVTVAAGDFWFCDPSFQTGVCTTTVQEGDTVVWDFAGSAEPHTTTECGASCDSPTGSPLWESGFIEPPGATFSYTFDTPGSYLYVCRVHPFDMRGQIVVEAAPDAGPTDDGGTGSSTPAPTASAPDGTGGLPAAGAGPRGGTQPGRLIAALAASGLVLSGVGLLLERRRWP
jgi:plastocyanin